MLETEIKRLTAAIERLTTVLDKSQLSLALDAAEPKAEKPVEEAKAEKPAEEPSVTVDALQTRCLELTRIDRANSPKIKALVASYTNGKLLKDIPANLLEEFAAKLEELA
jgi:hypothetical protein